MGELLSWNMLKLACFHRRRETKITYANLKISFPSVEYFIFIEKKSILALSCRHKYIYNSLYLLYWLKKFCQFFNSRNYPKIFFSIQTFGAESIMVECIFIFHGRKLIRVFLYCLGKTRGPIIYFFDGRSPSRYFVHLDNKKVP